MSHCRACDATIEWQVTAAGKRTPVNPDGTPHWATCPEAGRFRRRKEPQVKRDGGSCDDR